MDETNLPGRSVRGDTRGGWRASPGALRPYPSLGRRLPAVTGPAPAYRLGIQTQDYGKCDHAIQVPGSGYDVGLLQNPETGGYRIYFDFYGGNGSAIQNKIGVGGERLLQLYGVHKATLEAKKRGYLVTRKAVPGTQKIQLCVTGM